MKEIKKVLKVMIIGLLAGIINGFFATGGGMILVPGFVYFLNLKETEARGTSVFCVLVMVLTSSIFYYKENYINWEISILCGIGGAIGGYIGATLLKKMSEKFLKMTFAIFLIYMAINFIFR